MNATLPEIQHDGVELHGGLDQITPILSLDPGVPRECVNVEVTISGKHGRISPYERFDGKTKPSDATYAVVQLVRFLAIPSVGQTLTGETTGTTGSIIAVTERYLVLTLVVGAGFSTSEVMKVGVTVIGTAEVATETISALLSAQYLNLAADVYRALIAAPPGSGPTRGVFSMINGGIHEVFAFRDNAGVTASVLYKASASSWTVVPMFSEISFTAGGTGVPVDGNTLTRGANTATIKRVMLESGSWAAGTAAGRFIITTPTPGSFTAGIGTAGAVGVTLSGAQTVITMLPGGTFEFDKGNFSGQSGTLRIYGCDRANRCFEFDGVTLAPIKTGLTTDVPSHLAVHQNHLFVSYLSSVLHSGIGTPYTFTALSGAAEYATGDTVSGFKVQPGSQDAPAILIGLQSSIKVLYGSAASGTNAFRPVNFNSEAGATPGSLQNLERCYFFSSQGVIDVARVQEFGNFASATLTVQVQPFIDEKLSLFTTSCIHRAKSQYRLFFSDGSGLYLTIVNGKHYGSMPVRFPNPVVCIWNGTLANSSEVTYFGSSNGMVYQLDRGSSFDGAEVEFSDTLTWNSMKSPRTIKSYRKASLEMIGSAYAAVNFEYTLGYGSTEFERIPALAYESGFSGTPRWDAVSWDAFIWDGTTTIPTEIEMSGSAVNLQVRLSGSSDFMYPFTMASLITHFIPRRGMK